MDAPGGGVNDKTPAMELSLTAREGPEASLSISFVSGESPGAVRRFCINESIKENKLPMHYF